MEFDLDRIGGERFLRDLVSEVLAAGEEALRFRPQNAGYEKKPDRSPVTEADRAVEARLRSFLARRAPQAAFVGEEEGESGAKGSAFRFIVDPIDGTRAFIRGLPTWSTLVGLEADGEPVLGIANLPADQDIYVAVRGHGATGNGRPLRVSAVNTLDAALVSHGGLHQFTEVGLGDRLLRLAEGTYTQRGFADFDGYRQLLLGRVDGMVDVGLKPWDLCAVAVLVREAGGRITSLEGEETIYRGSAVATNGAIHDALLTLLR